MPCNCDHMEPNSYEIEHAKVEAFLEELNTNILSKCYNRPNKVKLDNDTATLCSRLSNLDVTKYSLEMQIWWRDHQQFDKIRIQREVEIQRKHEIKKNALSKLTTEEKEALVWK